MILEISIVHLQLKILKLCHQVMLQLLYSSRDHEKMVQQVVGRRVVRPNDLKI
jgi:hypothetical protein